MDIETAKKIFANDRFAAHSGIEIIETAKGYCKTRLAIQEIHLNAANVVQGGAIFTLADFAFAIASNSHGRLALAINANISFINSTSSGTLTATATEVSDPKKLGLYDVLVEDDKARIVARFTGMVYRKREEPT